MLYSFLGRSGLRVSRLSFGSWVTFHNQVDVDLAYEIMKVAYKGGINFFDNAETYAKGKAEIVMGEAIKKGVEEKVWERDDLVLSTKIFFGYKKGVNAVGLSRKHVVEGMMASLKRYQLDYVDVVFCHRPDPYTPMEEIVRAFNHVIDRGMAFYWATSEWSAQQITEACEVAEKLNMISPIADQCEYNLFARDKVDREYECVFKKYGYGTTIWSPLANGVLTGKYSKGKMPDKSRFTLENYKFLADQFFSEENQYKLEAVDNLRPIADKLDCTIAQLTLAWTIYNPNVSTCILGATSVHQLEENLKAVDVRERLTPEIVDKIEEIFKTRPAPDSTMRLVNSVRDH
mmetsp:Transcript_3894/g.11642  ORF Transcript_3894/g.11642 Transcript_3894/m.11642 type:complete len:345 (+) Transcript_3894:82-1116(+)|eukprot:CAMPEP_0198730002 /NCGR_PEP_ID=MMETSP1475-20131203/22304_1 /TAXON_ID= ORGANISM="Unidentified sp., Strain CCMP1999" /NCGR_SAMPLE_ID=MMETSP1475 /ASSEMBLY_ACC=CAM_ASM_001111 /LENGTH=344 /DNA_ID=CAMNT_0044492745 /DNA_START=56 /DNA_END=1090 /DNA_ORIENTATION=+